MLDLGAGRGGKLISLRAKGEKEEKDRRKEYIQPVLGRRG